MLPDPLHPAVVHLPIALAVLIPAFAILATWMIYKGFIPARGWALVVALQLLLVVSSWAALETGERDEERVEEVVAERHIEEHEEAAERFLILAGVGLLVMGAGLLPSRHGALGRALGTAATIAVLAAGVSVGHSGGELVYQHGAANAYLDDQVGTNAAHSSREYAHDDDDD